MTHKMHIPPDKVEQTRMFFRTRGGVLLWHNQEIGVVRDELMTPATHGDGTPATPPHWAYGKPEPLKPEDIAVRTETKVEPPLEWFPVCDYCEGTGRYPLVKVAEARGVSIDSIREQFCEEEGADTDTIKCTACSGTGHTNRTITIRIKRHWTGIYEPVSRKKPDALAKELGEGVLWTWGNVGHARGEVVFYREKIEPFTLEAS